MISKVVGAVSALILIRGLVVSDYASFVAFNGIATLFMALVGSGINLALVRFAAEHLSRTGQKPHFLYITALVIETALYAVFLAICALFPTQVASLLLGQSSSAKAVQLGVLYGFGLLLLEFTRSLYQAEERFTFYIGVLWLRQGITFILLGGLWIFRALSFDVAAWLIAWVNVVFGIGVGVYSIGRGGWVSLARIVKEGRQQMRGFLSAMGWLIAYFLALSASGRIDIMMLSRFASERALAAYGVAFQYYAMALLFLGSINSVLLPKFSRVEMQMPGAQTAFLRRWLRYSVWTAVPFLLFDLMGKPLFVWINGAQYEQAFGVFVVLSVGIWLSLVFSPVVNVLIARKDFQFLFALGAIALVISLVGSYALVRLLGGIGAAISVVLSAGFVNVVAALRVRRRLDARNQLRDCQETSVCREHGS
jgi:O-antigen/teichoic acid export membrane protein